MSDWEFDDDPDDNDEIEDLDDDNPEEDEDEVEVIDENAPSTKGKKINDSDWTSVPFLTKYERARILGTRAL